MKKQLPKILMILFAFSTRATHFTPQNTTVSTSAVVTGKVAFPDSTGVWSLVTLINESNPGLQYPVETDEDGNWLVNDVWTTVKNDNTDLLPETFKIYQNYPNPIGDETAIGFETPVAGNVTITIYNILGEEVSKKTDFYEAGQHGIRYVPKGAAGVYFYRIEGPRGEVAVRKLVQLDGFPHGGLKGKVNVNFSDVDSDAVTEVAPPAGYVQGFQRGSMPKPGEAHNGENVYTLNLRPKPGYDFFDELNIPGLVIEGDTTNIYTQVQERIDGPQQLNLNFDEADSQEIALAYVAATGDVTYFVVNVSDSLLTEVNGPDGYKVLSGRGAHDDVSGVYQDSLRVVAPHKSQIVVPVDAVINAQPDLDLEFQDASVLDSIITNSESRLMVGGQVYKTSDGKLKVQLTPGSHIVSAASDSAMTPYIIELGDGQRLVSYPGKNHGNLVLGTDDQGGIVTLINKHFDDHNIYNRTFNHPVDTPSGFDGWCPPNDGSDPPGTVTQYTMGIDSVAADSNTVNVYIYLGEDSTHQLQPPFDVIRSAFYLHTMPDSVKEKIAQYVVGELNEYHNTGRKQGEEYNVNVYVGRDPPLRYVMENGSPNVWPKVGWHVFFPGTRNRANSEVGPDNRIYSARTVVDTYHAFSEKAMKIDGAQPVVGARSDIEIADGTELITFFHDRSPPEIKTFQPWDYGAINISNKFGMGFKLK